MSTVALLLRNTASAGQEQAGANGLRVIACGQTAVARRDGLLDGRLQTRDRATEQRKLVKAQRKLLKAQRKLTDGPCRAQGVMVSGVKSATALFATEAQGRAHQDETREIICENSRLQVVSEGKPHRGRAMDGNFRCAASPDER